jgi:hypothetical protein
MTSRFLLLTVVAAGFAALLAGTASARFEPGDGGAGDSKRERHAAPTSVATASSPESASEPGVEVPDSAEATGTATTDGSSVTVTRTDGTTLTCAVPPGVDLTPFLTGQVQLECQNVNGVLTLREIEAESGARDEVNDDGTSETEPADTAEDQGEQGDDQDDDQGDQGDDDQGDDDQGDDDEQGEDGD